MGDHNEKLRYLRVFCDSFSVFGYNQSKGMAKISAAGKFEMSTKVFYGQTLRKLRAFSFTAQLCMPGMFERGKKDTSRQMVGERGEGIQKKEEINVKLEAKLETEEQGSHRGYKWQRKEKKKPIEAKAQQTFEPL